MQMFGAYSAAKSASAVQLQAQMRIMKSMLLLLAVVVSTTTVHAKPSGTKEKSNKKRKVTFQRDGLTLVGDLFTPENFDEKGRYKAIIVEGSFSSVKEQMAGTYAQKFANEGFIALAFDYSHYGASEGKPRQLESPAVLGYRGF